MIGRKKILCNECGHRMKELTRNNLKLLQCTNKACRYVCPRASADTKWWGIKALG